MRIRWTEQAVDDLAGIKSYIARDSAVLAQLVLPCDVGEHHGEWWRRASTMPSINSPRFLTPGASCRNAATQHYENSYAHHIALCTNAPRTSS